MSLIPVFNDGQILFSANLKTAFANVVNIAGDTMTGPLIVPSITASSLSKFEGGLTSNGTVTFGFPRFSVGGMNVFSTITSAFVVANASQISAQAAFDSGNSTSVLAQAAFDTANTILAIPSGSTSQQTFLTSNGITANTSVNLTVVGNNTVILSANGANTTQVGVVQLNDTLTSTSITQAATANAVRNAFITGNAAFVQANNVNTFAASAFNIANSALNLSQSAFSVANTNIGVGKVSKTGDTMTGNLIIIAPGTCLSVSNNAIISGILTITGNTVLNGGTFGGLFDGTANLTGSLTLSGAGPAFTVLNNAKINGTATIGNLVTTGGGTIGAALTVTNNAFVNGGILNLGVANGGGGSIINTTNTASPLTFSTNGIGGYVWKDNFANVLMSLTTSVFQISTPIKTNSTYVATGPGSIYTFSGNGSISPIAITTNFTGSYSGTDGILSISNASDDVAVTSADGFALAGIKVNRQVGGANTQGPRAGGFIGITMTQPVIVKPTGGYIALAAHAAALANAGGTGLIGSQPSGLLYAFYPQSVLHHGATNFVICSLGEGDIGIQPSSQTFDITGTIAANDIFSLVVTSADVPGSPVTLTATAGSADTAASIVNKLMAAFRAPGLDDAGIGAMQTSIQQLNVMWQVQKSAVTLALTTTGSATITPGSIISGASAQQRRGFTINRSGDDGSRGDSLDVAFEIGAIATASPASGFQAGLSFRAEGMAPTSTLIRTVNQKGFSASNVSGPFNRLQSKYGIDFSLMNFTQAGGLSIKVPGVGIGAGSINIQNAIIQTNSSGLILDVPSGLIGIGNPTIVNGGIGVAGADQWRYFNGDIIQDGNGGQYLADGIDNSTGKITHLTTLVQPSTTGNSLGIAIVTTGGSGNGLTITSNVAPTNYNLSLMPSGGNTIIGGNLSVANNFSLKGIDIGSGLQAAFNKANSGGGSITQTFITANGITVNTGTSLTVSGNNIVIFSANIGNTTKAGIIQLNDTFTSTSTALAVTANVANTIWTTTVAAFTKANGSIIKTGDAMTGTLTVPNLTSNGNIITNVLVSNSYIGIPGWAGFIETDLVANGTTQNTALILQPMSFHIIGTCLAGANSVILWDISKGVETTLVNRGTTPLNIFPPIGQGIDSQDYNTGIQIAAGGSYLKIVQANSSSRWVTTSNISGSSGTSTGAVAKTGDTMSGTLTVPNLIANANIVSVAVVASGVVNSAIIGVVPITPNTNYILSMRDSGQVITFANANTTVVNVNSGLPIGFRTVLTQIGAGSVTIRAGAGVTLNARIGSNNTILSQFGSASLFCYATNAFILDGSIQ